MRAPYARQHHAQSSTASTFDAQYPPYVLLYFSVLCLRLLVDRESRLCAGERAIVGLQARRRKSSCSCGASMAGRTAEWLDHVAGDHRKGGKHPAT